MMNLQKREGENELEHHKRLVFGKLVDKTLSDVDYTELAEEVYSKQYSSDVARRMMYGSRYTLELLEKAGINNISESDILKEIEEKQRELKKERVKLQTEKLEYNKWIREQARAELFEEKVINAIKDNMVALKVPNREIIKENNEKAAVLLISDLHYGSEFEIKGLEGEILNEYSVGIFEKRMWKLLDIVVNNLEKEKIKHLHIFNLADSIQGILRSGSQLMKLKYGITDGIMKFTNFMACWLGELSEYVSIDYYQNTGNHSDYRILSGKKNDYPHENAERMVGWALKAMLQNNPHIKIHEEQIQGLIYINIVGFDILATHGDKERKLENSIKDYNILYGKNIDYLLVGHKHFASESNVAINKSIIQCPSLIGIDDFSMSIKKSANAGAKMFILERDYGRSVDYNIKLD